MNIDQTLEMTKGIPFIETAKRRELHQFVVDQRPKKILELGFAHGVSACTMAAGMEEAKVDGVVDAVDILPAKEWQDKLISIEALSEKMGLAKYIRVHREAKSYTWWLKKELENKKTQANWQPYDFIFIDGAHNWTIDATAFFICEKLLAAGGWILFDDLKYSYRNMINSDGRSQTAGVNHYDMSQDEIDEPAVGKIFDLLVMDHEHFGQFRFSQNEDWGWAQKLASANTREVHIHRSYSIFNELMQIKDYIGRKIKR